MDKISRVQCYNQGNSIFNSSHGSVTPKLNLFFIHFQVRNEKARRYLSSMRKKDPVPFSKKFPSADPLGLKLLEKLLAFDPKDRPTIEEVVLCCCLK